MSAMSGFTSSDWSFSSSLSSRPGGRKIAGGVTVVWTGVMLTSAKAGGGCEAGGRGRGKKEENDLGVSVCSDCSR